jgi:RNA 3'-terminal phosphate cyclase
MSRNDDMTSISIAVSVENRNKIAAYAAQKNYKVTSDYIRRVIEADMRANGVDIDLSVDRGGYRIRGGGEKAESGSEES